MPRYSHPAKMAKKHTRLAIDALVKTLEDDKTNNRERVQAARMLLTIAWGTTPKGSTEQYEGTKGSSTDKFKQIIDRLNTE